MISWSPPLKGQVKLSTDSSSKGNQGILRVGGLIRDHYGNWIVGFSSMAAKLWTIFGLGFSFFFFFFSFDSGN